MTTAYEPIARFATLSETSDHLHRLIDELARRAQESRDGSGSGAQRLLEIRRQEGQRAAFAIFVLTLAGNLIESALDRADELEERLCR